MSSERNERTVAQARWPVWKANGAGLREQSESQNGASPELAHGGSDVMQSLPARLDEYMVDPAGGDTGALAPLEGAIELASLMSGAR